MYALYHTLNKDLEKKKLSKRKIKELATIHNNLFESELKTEENQEGETKFLDIDEAIFMLIMEHARLNEEYDTSKLYDKKSLPYNIKDTKTTTDIPLETLPVDLQQIIYKFMKMMDN